jgi:hypothetical protein
LWGLDARLKSNEQKTEKLFRILETRENIQLGMTRLGDTTYKTNFGRSETGPAPIPFHTSDPVPTRTTYRYSETVADGTINSRLLPNEAQDLITGLSQDNPFRGNQLIQETIGEEPEDRTDQGFYGDPEDVQEMPDKSAEDSRVLREDYGHINDNRNLEVLYEGEGVSAPRFEDRQERFEGGESEADDAEEEAEEEEEELQRHNFVSNELMFTTGNLEGTLASREMGSTIGFRNEAVIETQGRELLEDDGEEGEEEQELVAQ